MKSFKQFVEEQAINEGKIADLVNKAKEFVQRKGKKWYKEMDKFWWDGHVSPKEMQDSIKRMSDEDLAKWVAHDEVHGPNKQNEFQAKLMRRELMKRYGVSPKGNLK